MSEVSITCDISQALARTRILSFLDKAAKKQATDWSSKFVKSLKRSAQNMKKSGTHSGFMADNIGQEISSDGKTILTGTGVGGTKSVVYANIQDEGGVIKPQGKYLTIPFKGILGRAANYANTFVFRAKSGNLIMAQKIAGEKFIPLFTLVKQVTIPKSGWFTLTKERMLPELNDAMTEEMILTRAVIMAGK